MTDWFGLAKWVCYGFDGENEKRECPVQRYPDRDSYIPSWSYLWRTYCAARRRLALSGYEDSMARAIAAQAVEWVDYPTFAPTMPDGSIPPAPTHEEAEVPVPAWAQANPENVRRVRCWSHWRREMRNDQGESPRMGRIMSSAFVRHARRYPDPYTAHDCEGEDFCPVCD